MKNIMKIYAIKINNQLVFFLMKYYEILYVYNMPKCVRITEVEDMTNVPVYYLKSAKIINFDIRIVENYAICHKRKYVINLVKSK